MGYGEGELGGGRERKGVGLTRCSPWLGTCVDGLAAVRRMECAAYLASRWVDMAEEALVGWEEAKVLAPRAS
jgi:hypothetical protein